MKNRFRLNLFLVLALIAQLIVVVVNRCERFKSKLLHRASYKALHGNGRDFAFSFPVLLGFESWVARVNRMKYPVDFDLWVGFHPMVQIEKDSDHLYSIFSCHPLPVL